MVEVALAKKDVSAIVSGGGLYLAIMTELVQAVRSLGGSDEDIHRLATPEGRSVLHRMASVAVGVRQEGERFHVIVNYDQSLLDMLIAGHFHSVETGITSRNFSLPETGIQAVDVELVHYIRFMRTKEILKDLLRRKLRPATLAEALALTALDGWPGKPFGIAALGSSIHITKSLSDDFGCSDYYFPYISSGGAGVRNLVLHGRNWDWRDDDRFAAVPL